MKKFFKKTILLLILSLPIILGCVVATDVGIAPEYETHFANYLKSSETEERVFVIEGVDTENTLFQNIRCIFYPNGMPIVGCSSTSFGGQLWQVIKYLGYALLVLFIVISGIKLLVNGSNADKVKQSLSSLLYIILGSVLLFGCIWILSVLHVGTSNTEGLAENFHGNEGSLLFIVLSFAKALAFIAAILMIVIHGFKMLSTADKSDKVKTGLKGLLNVIVALVIIKLIDYIYYIAQLSDIVSKTTDLIIEIAKVMGFIIGSLMMIMLFYAGFLFITDQGSTKNMEKAKNIIIGILVTAIVIFSLLLIIYQVVNEFA